MFKFSRIKLGFSQRKFAKLLGLPRTTYQSYENGRRKPSKTKEKEIRKKIKQLEKRIDSLDEGLDINVAKYLIYLLDIVIFAFALVILWGLRWKSFIKSI